MIKIGSIELKNPVMTASGTFGYAREYAELVDVSCLGAIVTKTITLSPRYGNAPPRIVETPSGLLNSIGLENGGVDDFIEFKLPYLQDTGVPVIVSIAAESDEEWTALAQRLDKAEGISGIELNLSCPNMSRIPNPESRIPNLIAQDARRTCEVVKAVREGTDITLITKLSPNVTDIVEIARAAVEGGTDAVALVNTFLGMAFDLKTGRPKLGNILGGLSGPAIRPIAVRMVWEVANKVEIPIIGMGGITTPDDAKEFFLAGATAVAVGTANFVEPGLVIKIAEEPEGWMSKKRL